MLPPNTIAVDLCKALCLEVQVESASDGVMIVHTPYRFPDGDEYQIYLRQLKSGGIRVSDFGHTMMQLSYITDISKIEKGNRSEVMAQVLRDNGAHMDNGEIFIETTQPGLANAVFRIGQAITSIHDISFLTKSRVISTFYEDLDALLKKIVPQDKLLSDYVEPKIEHGAHYPIDYRIDGGRAPLLLFGIPGKDKARLSTIVLQQLIHHKVDFDSLLVFEDQQKIDSGDRARLMNVGGEMIASLDAAEDLERKIHKKIYP